MKILVDTLVWAQHFKQSNNTLVNLLLSDSVLCHPLVISEIACDILPSPRQRTLTDLSSLEQSAIATHQDILAFIEQHQLYGQGFGYIDLALLASASLSTNCQLWTLDKRLNQLAKRLGISFKPNCTSQF